MKNFDGDNCEELAKLTKSFISIKKNQEDSDVEKVVSNYLKETKSQIEFPRLTNFILSSLPKKTQYDIDDMFSLFTLIKKEEDLYYDTKSYYFQIIHENCFGIPQELFDKKIISNSVLSTAEYTQFEANLSFWYSKQELIIFNLSLLKKYFNVNLDFRLYDKVSDNKGYDAEINHQAQKGLLNLGGKVVSKISLGSGLNNLGFTNVLAAILVGGFRKIGIFSTAFNYFTRKASRKLIKDSELVEIRKLSSMIKKICEEFDEINQICVKLLTIHITRFIGEEKEGVSKEEEEELIEKVKKKLWSFAFDDKFEFEVCKSYEEKTEQNNWVNLCFDK